MLTVQTDAVVIGLHCIGHMIRSNVSGRGGYNHTAIQWYSNQTWMLHKYFSVCLVSLPAWIRTAVVYTLSGILRYTNCLCKRRTGVIITRGQSVNQTWEMTGHQKIKWNRLQSSSWCFIISRPLYSVNPAAVFWGMKSSKGWLLPTVSTILIITVFFLSSDSSSQ